MAFIPPRLSLQAYRSVLVLALLPAAIPILACDPRTTPAGTCGASITMDVAENGRPYYGAVGATIRALPSARLAVDLHGEVASVTNATWALTSTASGRDGGGGSLTGRGMGADLVVPTAVGSYRVTATLTKTDGSTCQISLALEVVEPGPCDADPISVALLTPGLPDMELADTMVLPPGAVIALRATRAVADAGAGRVTLDLASASDGALSEDAAAGTYRYTAPTTPGTYRLFATSYPAAGPACRREIKLTVRDGCVAFQPTRTGAGIAPGPFGPSPITVASGAALTLGLEGGAAAGASVMFSVVEGAAGGSLVASGDTAATYTAPGTIGRFTLRGAVRLGGAVSCVAFQTVDVGTAPVPGLLKSPWPRDFLSVGGGKVAGANSSTVARINVDGSGYEEVGATSNNIGGVAATSTGAVYWSYAPSTTTLLYGTAPNPLSFYDSVNGGAGTMTSDGTNVFYVVYTPSIGSVIRKVSPPTTGGATVATTTTNALVGTMTTANGYVYWGKALATLSGTAVGRRRIDLGAAEQTIIPDGELNGVTWGIASIAADATTLYALFNHVANAADNIIRFKNADGSGGATQAFVSAPGAVAIAADATHVYWLTRDAHLRRKLRNGAGSIEDLANAPGEEGWALALDATAAYFTTNDSLRRHPK